MLNRFCESLEAKLKSYVKQNGQLQRIGAFHIFMDIFDYIIKLFDHVTNNPSSWSHAQGSIVDAISPSKAMLNFDFIIALHTVEWYMSYTESLTQSL